MGRNRKQRLKKREFFQYQDRTWEVLHKLNNIVYAIELSRKGLAQGAIERFQDTSGGEMTMTENIPAMHVMTGKTVTTS